MENHVRLMVLSDNLSPEKLIKQLAMSGDKIWSLGDKRLNTLLLEKENGWVLKSKIALNLDLEDQIENVMSLIKWNEARFKAISNQEGCFIQLSCACYYDDEPPLIFESEVINWLSDLNASLDIDLYCRSKG